MEAAWMSIDRWMGKEVAVHVYNGVLLSCKKEQTGVSCSDVDEPRACYTEWSKLEKQVLYINTHIYGI